MSEKHHENFKARLKRSQKAVEIAKRWLDSSDRYEEVHAPVLKISPKHKQWKDYIDHGDLVVRFKGSKELCVVEVKWLQYDFTNHYDWPHMRGGEAVAIVCARHAFDSRWKKPVVFLQFNKELTHCLVIMTETFPNWWVDSRPDHERLGYEQEFYITKLREHRILEVKIADVSSDRDSTQESQDGSSPDSVEAGQMDLLG